MYEHMHGREPFRLPEPMTIDPARIKNDSPTLDIVKDYITKHETRYRRYEYLENLYKGFHDVYKAPEKPAWKPDNRLAVNFPRDITDTFIGYAYGIPIRESHPDEKFSKTLQQFYEDNDIDDHELELAKYACQFGHCFEYFYQDENAKTKVVAKKPTEVFVVYDDTLKKRALFAVRYGRYTTEGKEHIIYGEVMTRSVIKSFDDGKITEMKDNPYGYIPVVEYILNEERMGLYEGVAGLIEAYNHTIGEKANDVDAFAEAYLAVLGAEIDEEGLYKIRDNRVINLYGTDDAKDILVQFLQKPTADGTQENLLDRLEKQIYQKSMVINLSDDTFGNNEAGIALAYKMKSMSDLAATFDRKMKKSIRKRYKIFCSLSTNSADPDAWKAIEITTRRNLPRNLAEEVSTAKAIEGIVSKETQLSLLSFVGSVESELERIEKEREESMNESAALMNMFGGDNGKQSGVLEAKGRGTTAE